MGGSSGGGDNTTSTTSQPWLGQIPYLLGGGPGTPGLFPEAGRLYETYRPEYFPGQQVAPIQPGTTAAQNYLWNYAGLQGPAPGPVQPGAESSPQPITTPSGGQGGQPRVTGGVGGGPQTASLGGPQVTGGVSQGPQTFNLGGGPSVTGGVSQGPQTRSLGAGVTGGVSSGPQNLGGVSPGPTQVPVGAQQGPPQQGGNLPALIGSAQGANQLLLSPDLLNAQSNPALQSYIDAATRPIYQNLTEQALPAIRSQFLGPAGGYGSTRQGIAEGLAISRAGQTAGDVAAQIASQGYGQGLDAQIRALGLAPSTGQLGALPAQYLDAVGQQNQLQVQAQIDAEMRRHAFEQNLPYQQLREYASIVGGPGYGGVSETTAPGTRTSRPLSALGGAASGAAIGGSFGGPYGAAIGGGVGLIAGLFG